MSHVAGRSTNEQLIESGDHVMLTRWFSAVALTIFVYDTAITLEEEMRFIWPKRWSLIKFCVYCNRLLCLGFLALNATQIGPFQLALSNRFCSVFFPMSGWMAYASFAMCNWILLARTNALLSRMKFFLIGLNTLYVLAYISTGGLVVDATFGLQGKMFRSNIFHACAISQLPRLMPYLWIPPMTFETTMFILTVWRVYGNVKLTTSLGSNLWAVWFRDGVWYYLVIIGMLPYLYHLDHRNITFFSASWDQSFLVAGTPCRLFVLGTLRFMGSNERVSHSSAD
ncbi:hypothetical protein FRC14_007065 [Serendipita sp. 396]|nr:hypothetical protein FRC14_007065 [Serendipita sp. 396]KAG8827989.1 hypothetical protein FRC19_010497 [Serendipita sp. 401]KAG8830509.1 hypothetical protein FRC18_007955 [Serendipita sp. 400]KAG8861623.1 hypothetical protein FRB91_003746 [Serendipita sp. 411]KAG9058253.1 hypothetical protein FS842_011133 [Serendipita sp. 407]